MFRFAGMALVTCAACSPVENAQVSDPATALDETCFRNQVQPVLGKYCSYLACHGIAGATPGMIGSSGIGAALRVYTPDKLRAMPAMTIADLQTDLTDAEQHANFESAAAFSYNLASPDDSFLLRKPLPAALGGYEHEGGAIFQSKTDPNYVAIEHWLARSCP